MKDFIARCSPEVRDTLLAELARQGHNAAVFDEREDVGEASGPDSALCLRQVREELSAIYDGMGDGVLIADAATGRFIHANPAICRLTGYSEAELLDLGVTDMHPAESLPKAQECFRAVASGRFAQVEAFPVLRKDGTTVYCDMASYPMSRHGKPSAVAFFHDVTARRQAERRLAASEARFRSLFEWAAVGGAVTDFEGRLIECNTALARMLGYEIGELIGRRALSLVHPDDQDEQRTRMREFIERRTGSVQFENRYLHKDGGILWARVSAAFLPEEGEEPRLLIAAIEDITDRKLAEQALQESEATLRTLIENMPDVVAMLDPDWNILYTNRGYGDVAPKEIVGTSGLLHACDEHRSLCREAMRRAIETRTVQTFEARDRLGGWWAARLIPVVENDAVRTLMFICADVSERKAAEASVCHEQELLRRLLDLFERDRELVAFEIHDGFSQQLTGSLLNFEAAAELRGSDPARADAAFGNGLRLLRESIEEARRLVRGLRPPVLDQFGIVPAIEHLLEDNPDGLGPKIEFISGMKSSRLARPLEAALFRMVQETLSNIQRHSRAERARIELRQDDHFVHLTVTDWGVGFDPRGVGQDHFGLRGIRERARLLGGHAEIDSAPARGARIHVVLPLVEASPPADKPADPAV